MKNIPFCTRLAVFIAVFVVLPLSIVLAAGSYSISNEYFVDDTDHARHFYRIPITPEGNPIEFGDFGFTSGLFLYGYGYSVFNGITNFGYGYGYGYNHYADNSTGLDDGNMRLGFFINPEAGETYDTVTLPYSEQAETRIVTVPFALPIILTESGNDGVYIRPGTNGLTITGMDL
jgi:hypothetical protein